MELVDLTRYGAPATDLHAAAGPLRAFAASNNVPLEPFSTIGREDVTAAIIGVDALLWLTGERNLVLPAGVGRPFAAAYARVLHRVAGRAVSLEEVGSDTPDAPGNLPEGAHLHVAVYGAWAAALHPDEPGEPIRRAAQDLGAGQQDGPLADVAALLDAMADLSSLPGGEFLPED